MIIKNINSLQRVFGDNEPVGEISSAVMLSNDVYNFQIAVCPEEEVFLKFKIETDIEEAITIRNVFSVPSDLEIYPDYDKNGFYEFSPNGMYPDVLKPLKNNVFYGKRGNWQSLWVTVNAVSVKPGKHNFCITFVNPHNGKEYAKGNTVSIEILDPALEDQRLIYTNWFHCDCLAHYYNEEVFSERFWAITFNYMKTAAEHGMNMILTPVFTPPLDTAVGTERLTVQLVDVKKENNNYYFSFEKLGRWIDTARNCGITYFEISHLFTQWGVSSCPKIMGRVNGEEKRIFGWDTAADSPEYIAFLDAFLPALISYLKKKNADKTSYFHISDEPCADYIDRYRFASGIIKKHLGTEFHTFDALSDYEFYENGLVETPIPATSAIEPFRNVKNLWTYYCCGQFRNGLSNRFFCMPSTRNRIIGVQLYIYNIEGFLQWGYNFYNTQNSFSQINPYLTTAAGVAFPSGDAFVVYPETDGTALSSLRFEVFADALRDLQALQTLEKIIGRQAVISIIQEGVDYEITMTEYPTDYKWLINLREKVNMRLNSLLK
ncbi:MAG: hypothetical protein DBX47_03860 [Clostridiales bacterium]|nr:MAG: hypothetical protein DBX47_03860 [Clostridiales bacterium]